MDGRKGVAQEHSEITVEPRTTIWAIAEVILQDASGKPRRIPATLEDTSHSGACVRIKTPVQIGSLLTIKWHRELFAATARNCRSDGREFLLGVRREPGRAPLLLPAPPPAELKEQPAAPREQKTEPTTSKPISPRNPVRSHATPRSAPDPPPATFPKPQAPAKQEVPRSAFPASPKPLARRSPFEVKPSSPGPERNVMQQPKKLLSRFWRSQTEAKANEKATPTEVPVNKPSNPAPDSAPRPADMLSYEDIYHAAGILNPASGYGIPKVMEMLNSERIRDLSKDIQRASILMALDAAGTSVDCILQDATRRQQALDAYETAKRKQIEDFEALKAQENSQIEAEMERLKAHYSERVQRNQEQIEQEKEVLRNWRMATQHESQRISEVIELCQKPAASAAAASAGSSISGEKKTAEPASTAAGRK